MRRPWVLSILPVLLLAAPTPSAADERPRPPMVDPAIDEEGRPFCYFSRPTDHLGVMDGEHGFQVTAEGWLYTRRFEVVFFAGSDRRPVRQRIRTLRDGRTPILDYHVVLEGIRYGWTLFAATLDGDPRGRLVAFVRMEARNDGPTPRRAAFGAAIRHRNPRGSTARVRADPAFPFRRRSRYAHESWGITRDGRALVFLASRAAPPPAKNATMESTYEGPFRGSELDAVEDTPLCPVAWTPTLAPGERRHADLVVPLLPVSPEEVPAVHRAVDEAFDAFLARTSTRWRALFDRAISLEIPEKKAHDTFWASVANVAIARDQVAPDRWVQRVNELQYHTGFWPRDASYFMKAWWYVGLPVEGRRVVDHYFRIQDPDGSFRHDPENISPYAIARWYRLTGDRAYAERAFPFLWRNFEWLRARRRDDPLGLMPRRGRYDNEAIDGHYTGHNFYNLCALREAAAMARDLGKPERATEIEAEHAAFRKTFLDRLGPLVERHGQIPPGLDTGIEGANWGNLVGSYPTEVLAPDHPWIEATSDRLRRDMYEEGLLIYNGSRWWSLHHYSTIKNTYSDLLRGRDDLVVGDLYALLTHTSASHAGFEFCLVGWSNRDFGGNLSPHGWFAAKLIGLVRLMLVREQGRDLHLLSALPPAWVTPGRHLEARNVLTRFGRMDLVMDGTDEGLRLRLALPQGEVGPDDVRVLVPWYARGATATVDGSPRRPQGRILTIPRSTRVLELAFDRDPAVAALDYEHAAAELHDAYRARFRAWVEAHPGQDAFEPYPERRFPTREDGLGRSRELAAAEGLTTGREARASSSGGSHPAGAASDGLAGRTAPHWCPGNDDLAPSWSVLLEGSPQVERVVVHTAEGSPPLRCRVRARQAGGTTPLADLWENTLPGPRGGLVLFFPPVHADAIELTFPAGADVRLTEVQVFDHGPPWQEARDIDPDAVPNLALGRPTCSSEWERRDGPWKAVDGRRGWPDGFWAGAVGHPQWWCVDLGSPQAIQRARLWFYAGDRRGYAWVLQSSREGIRWRTLANHRTPIPVTNDGHEALFDAHSARYLRVVVLENSANPAAHVSEVEVYGPEPPQRASPDSR